MQGRSSRQDLAQWHYADPGNRVFGPYPAEAIARLFQFGHIRLETPVWCGDPDRARPLRECTDVFEIGPGNRIHVLAPDAATAGAQTAPPQPDQVPEPSGPEPDPAPEPVAADPPTTDPAPAAPVAAGPAPVRHRRLRWTLAALATLLAATAVALRFAT